MLQEAKITLVVMKKSQLLGSSLLEQKMDPIRDKNTKFCFLKNVAISQDHYPKNFKFSGYKGLIHRKICPRQLKTNIIWSRLQWVLISHLGHFMMMLDHEISV